VDVRLASTHAKAVLEVENSGSYIPPDERERLFERFFRASSASEQSVPGIGLGLTISKAIVTAHHGRIDVRSEKGLGTTFRVELPLSGGSEVLDLDRTRREKAA
jgi:signal transduction histidine kinase